MSKKGALPKSEPKKKVSGGPGFTPAPTVDMPKGNKKNVIMPPGVAAPSPHSPAKPL